MTLETSFIIVAVLILSTMVVICRYCKFDLKFSIALVFLSMILFVMIYHYGINQYKLKNNLKAFESIQQVKQCGTYQQRTPLNQISQTNEVIYQFKSEQNQIIEFNGDALTQHYYPLLAQVKKGDQICFTYAKDVKDWHDRYYLTQLSKPIKHP